MADQLCTSGFAGKVYTLNVRSDPGSSGIQYPRHRVSDGNPILRIMGTRTTSAWTAQTVFLNCSASCSGLTTCGR